LQIEIPVSEEAPADENLPGLWIAEGDLSNSGTGNNNNLVAANVALGQCLGDTIRTAIQTKVNAAMSALPSGTTPSIISPTVRFSPLGFPDLPHTLGEITALLTEKGGSSFEANQVVNVTNWSDNQGTLVTLTKNSPNTESSKGSESSNSAKETGKSNKSEKGKESELPATSNIEAAESNGCQPSSTPGVFPQVGDTALPEDLDKDGTSDTSVYNYVVSGLNNADLKVVPGCKVRFHLVGNIAKNAEISHDCTGTSACKPTDMQIFSYGIGTDICLNGQNTIDAAIFAFDSNVGVLGGGNSGGIRGLVWAKSWNKGDCGSNSASTPVLVQAGSWADLGQDLFPKGLSPQLGVASSWKQLASE